MRRALAASGRLCYTASDFHACVIAADAAKNAFWQLGKVNVGLTVGRVVVSESASNTIGIAQRYTTAVFELAAETKKLDGLEKDITALETAIADSDDLQALLVSPIYSREAEADAMATLADKMKLSPMMSNTLKLLAQKRRLFVLPQVLAQLRQRIADEKGLVTAEVTTAKALTKAQSEKLAKTLKAQVGKDVDIVETVDETLIGGLIVKMGSQMVDTSVRSKLSALQTNMKEVG